MRKTFLLTLSLLSSLYLAQVGINTTTPTATLDVKALTTSTASTIAEGLIAPRLSRSDLISKDAAYTSSQTGTLVYVLDTTGTLTIKTNNVTTPGYYYFDGTIWQKIISTIPNDTNIYNTDGTVQNNRTVALTDKTLSFTAGTPSVNQFSIDGSTFSVDSQNDRIGIGTSAPTAKLDINGNLRIRTTANSNGSTNVSTLVRDNTTGEVKIAVSSTGNSTPLNYIVYTISNVNGDWINNYDTKINSSDYTMTVVGSSFNSPLNTNNVVTPATYAPSSVFAFISGTTWRLTADYLATSTQTGVNGTWTIYCLVINNSILKTLTPVSQDLGGSNTGAAAATPAGL
ncbi:hypothetical protein [Chryseobacterium viscerum]|uniref:Uncharacterized protein n=1 Tax=Chryseobacterium viscerum TaxID=1037377 RepID=A0A316WD91_9FLAO|nr:hypothetical protein [Chryseobacterium viscerum]PWN57986.1 hypothetical protein C1634_024920 [Chryseobacterium viscerum]